MSKHSLHVCIYNIYIELIFNIFIIGCKYISPLNLSRSSSFKVLVGWNSIKKILTWKHESFVIHRDIILFIEITYFKFIHVRIIFFSFLFYKRHNDIGRSHSRVSIMRLCVCIFYRENIFETLPKEGCGATRDERKQPCAHIFSLLKVILLAGRSSCFAPGVKICFCDRNVRRQVFVKFTHLEFSYLSLRNLIHALT